MFCTRCGKEFKGNFCPDCGTPAESTAGATEASPISDPQAARPSSPSSTRVQPNKKIGCGCLVLIVVILAALIGVITSDAPAAAKTSEEILAFDDRSWDDFAILYQSHNNFLAAVQSYSDNKIASTSFYQKCQEAEEFFRDASTRFDYGTTKDEKDYLSVFRSAALSDQLAAKALMKYLDSGKTSDLADSKSNIQAAKDAITMIASNRGILLAKSDLSEEEIKQRIEESMSKLE